MLFVACHLITVSAYIDATLCFAAFPVLQKNLAAGVVIPDVMGVQGNDLAKIMAEYQAAAAKKLELEEKRRQRLR